MFFAVVSILVVTGSAVGFARYVSQSEGAARASAVFAGGLVALGVWLLVWSFIRRPPAGEPDDFLDKFLADAGQALLLGAVLSFGFGVVGQLLEDERTVENRALDLVRQMRTDAGESSALAGHEGGSVTV